MILPFMPEGAHVILLNYMTQERVKRVARTAEAEGAAEGAEGAEGAAKAGTEDGRWAAEAAAESGHTRHHGHTEKQKGLKRQKVLKRQHGKQHRARLHVEDDVMTPAAHRAHRQ